MSVDSGNAEDRDLTAEQDAALRALFADANEVLPGSAFQSATDTALAHGRRRTLVGRAVLSLVLVVLLAPVQDIALDLSAIMLTVLVELENDLAAQLLAPINSVGAAVSLTLLTLRLAHRRLFGLRF